jgi:hypothetical protein
MVLVMRKDWTPKSYYALLEGLPKDSKGRYKTNDVLRLLRQEHIKVETLKAEKQHLRALFRANGKL